MRKLTLTAVTGVLVAPIAALAMAGTAIAAPQAESVPTGSAAVAGSLSSSTEQAPPKAVPLTLAPSCVSFTQYNHNFYTNVYVDNSCRTSQRIKIIMTNGNDSNCTSVPAGTIDYFFRSNSDNGLMPYVTRIDAC